MINVLVSTTRADTCTGKRCGTGSRQRGSRSSGGGCRLPSRAEVWRELPLIGTDGRPFRFSNVDAVQKLVHLIDQQAGGQILADEVVTNLRSSNRYLVSSLIEEAMFWPQDNTLLHCPPPADQLPDRLQAMCAFANGEEIDGFIHPVVRAIIVHFWLAYDHPFVDGNGRTARALFYRSMLHEGYWLTRYLSISSILKKAPAKYAKSYLYSETDDNDITYFVIYQLKVGCAHLIWPHLGG